MSSSIKNFFGPSPEEIEEIIHKAINDMKKDLEARDEASREEMDRLTKKLNVLMAMTQDGTEGNRKQLSEEMKKVRAQLEEQDTFLRSSRNDLLEEVVNLSDKQKKQGKDLSAQNEALQKQLGNISENLSSQAKAHQESLLEKLDENRKSLEKSFMAVQEKGESHHTELLSKLNDGQNRDELLQKQLSGLSENLSSRAETHQEALMEKLGQSQEAFEKGFAEAREEREKFASEADLRQKETDKKLQAHQEALMGKLGQSQEAFEKGFAEAREEREKFASEADLRQKETDKKLQAYQESLTGKLDETRKILEKGFQSAEEVGASRQTELLDRLHDGQELVRKNGEETAKLAEELEKQQDSLASHFTGVTEKINQLEAKEAEWEKQAKAHFEREEASLAGLADASETNWKDLKIQAAALLPLLQALQKDQGEWSAKDASRFDEIMKKLELTRRMAVDGSRYASEGVWGTIFNQVIKDSTWLKDTAFAAGRWAVGYQYLYAVYRILNEVKPQNILELGLGQSTKLISQYAAACPSVHHQIVEHDPLWMDFFRKNYNLPGNTEMVQLDREFVPYKEAEKVRVFKNFAETFKGQKFDFISIDAPLGGDMKQYARIDVLQLLPDCLADSFIIVIDDAERSGETHTIREMTETLKRNDISFAQGRYSGKKDCVVICSENLKFVCSM